MSDCRLCGRDDGHYIGCDGIVSKEAYTHTPAQLAEANECEHDGCSRSKWSDSPRTKFCVDHKDPKSREK